MKKFISTLFALFVICSTTVFGDTIKFAQITDAHLSVNSEYSEKVLKSAVADINKQSDISFVVFTGDNINNPKEENLRSFLKIASKLNVPYYFALGDHDVYKSNKLSKIRYFEIIKEENFLFPQTKPNYKFKKNSFVFMIADGAKEVIPGQAGYYRDDTLTWIDKTLSKYEKSPVVIFQHYPIEYPEGAEGRLKTHRRYKVEKYREIIDKHHNVLAIISGHFHMNSESMKNGVYHISSPSLLNLPHSYKIIDIVTTKEFSPIIYTQLREFELKD